MPDRIRKTGLPPGSVIFTGNRKVEKILIHYLEFNEQEMEEQLLDNQTITAFHEPVPDKVQWYDTRGLHDTALIEEIGKVFKVHPLVLEDIADIHQRPKLDIFDAGIYISLKALSFDEVQMELKTEQIGIFLGDNFVLSFQEDEEDLFPKIRERLRTSQGRIRKKRADFLAYALMDNVIDHYYLIFDRVENKIEHLEALALSDNNKDCKYQIHELKRKLMVFKKAIIPLRDVLNRLEKLEHQFIDEKLSPYFRDLLDHLLQMVDLLETFRETLNGLYDLYLSELSYRMNSVMRVLTIISTIFIPLTFLAGIYGMNFEFMPELHFKYGYFVLWGIMLTISLYMLRYFKKKGWLN